MARVFLSHSSRDSAAAAELKTWLDEQGFAPAFLDFDKHGGIPAGADWERTLYEQIQRCQALLILQTPNWSASRWCFAEFTQARALGKPIFQVVQSDEAAAEIPIAADLQRLDLRHDRPAGLEQLRRELERIALQDQGGFPWPPPNDPSRSPFPGLMEFEAEDAPVFFGRDSDWRAVIERLNTRRAQGGPRLLVLQGASGSGKSSLLRAGVLPRLRRAGRQWLVLPVLRPQARPLESLAQTLALALQRPEAWRDLHQQLLSTTDASALAGLFAGWAADLRLAAAAPEAQLLLPIDQAEELFTVAEAAERERFVDVLATALQPALPLQAVMTIRADAMGSLQALPELVNILETLPLGPLSLERYREIIEGPARVSGLKAEPAFVERAIHDTATEDALPLLAFALRRLHEDYGADGVLSLSDYQALGDPAAGLSPLENAVKQAADTVLKAQRPDEASLKALREAFVPAMVRVSEQGSYARRAAAWDSLPPLARPLLEALVAARLLVRRQGEGEPSTVEVAHEALLRVWPLLRGWLDDSRDFLLGSQQLEQDLAQWQAASPADQPRALLSGLKLAKGRAWLAERGNQLRPELRRFIQSSQHRAVRQQRILLGSAAAAFAVISGAAGLAFLQLQRARAAQVAQFEATHRALITSDPFLSVVYGLAAAGPLLDGQKPWEAAQLSQTLLQASRLNQASAAPIQTNQGWLSSVIEMGNGDLISGGSDGRLKRWRDGRLVASWLRSRGGPVLSLMRLKNGDVVSGDSAGLLFRWRNGKPEGPIIDTKQELSSLAESSNGDIISGGRDGTIKRWRNGEQVGMIDAKQNRIESLLELKDGQLVSGADDGTIKRWRDGGQIGGILDAGPGSVESLAQLPNGTLISGSLESFPPVAGLRSKGTLRIFSNFRVAKTGPQASSDQAGIHSIAPLRNGHFVTGDDYGYLKWWSSGTSPKAYRTINTGQGGVYSLAVLANGDLASVGRDGTLKRWIGAPETISQLVIPPQKIEYSAIARLSHGRIAVADQRGNLEVWSGGKRIGESITAGQAAVSNILQLRNGDLITAGSDGALKHWRDGQAMEGAKPTSVTQDVAFTMLETRSGELLIVGRRDGSVSRWKNGDHMGTFNISEPGRGVLALLELDNGDLLAGYEDGMVQRWRNGRRFGEEMRVVQGDLRRSLFRMFLVGLPNNGWLSSTSGQGTTGNGKLHYWLNGMPAADGHSLDTGVMDTGRGELLGILLSDKGEILIGTTTGVHRISLPNVASSLCSQVTFATATANASLLLAVNAARDTCRSLGSKQS